MTLGATGAAGTVGTASRSLGDAASTATERLRADVDALLGPQVHVAGHPLVAAAGEVAAAWAPGAERADQDGVDRSRVDVAARAGLLGATAPADAGGGDAPPAVGRAVTELLAGACGATWFVTAQHALPVALAVGSPTPAAERWRRPLCTGTTLAATAVAHLRRSGPPPVRATADGDGWRLDGTVGWLTSWGLADVLLLGARAGDDLVLGLVPARDADGLAAGEPMRLAAMQGTRTTTLALDGFRLAADDVLDVVPASTWLAADTARTANVVPAVFGLLASLCRALAEASGRPGAGPAADVARRAAEQGAALRARAYALVDDVPAEDLVEERLALRASSLHLLVATSGALVAAWAGAAMSLDHPAQRWAREALFHLVQAQTGPVREATLRRWDDGLSAPGRAPSPTR